MKKNTLPPTYFLVFLVLSIALHFIFPVIKFIYPPLTYLGWIFVVFGVVLNIWSDRLFKKNKTTIDSYDIPKRLVVNGPFRISRHPIYLGMLLVLLGVAILHGTLITFLFPLFFIAITESKFIPKEERNLERVFGKRYLDYKSKVRRWL